MFGWTLLIGGTIICLLNFYLSLLRYPLHRAMRRSREGYRPVSGIPILGSLAVIVAWTIWIRHERLLALHVATWTIAVIDTGGIHWFAAMMIYSWCACPEDHNG